MELTPLQHHRAVLRATLHAQTARKQLRPRGRRKPADNEGQVLQPASCSRLALKNMT